MSQFTGRQYKGAMRDRQEQKRVEAAARDAMTRPERKSLKNPANKRADVVAHNRAAA